MLTIQQIFSKIIQFSLAPVHASRVQLLWPTNHSTLVLPVHHKLLDFQILLHRKVSDAIQLFILLSSLLPLVFPSIRVFPRCISDQCWISLSSIISPKKFRPISSEWTVDFLTKDFSRVFCQSKDNSSSTSFQFTSHSHDHKPIPDCMTAGKSGRPAFEYTRLHYNLFPFE